MHNVPAPGAAHGGGGCLCPGHVPQPLRHHASPSPKYTRLHHRPLAGSGTVAGDFSMLQARLDEEGRALPKVPGRLLTQHHGADRCR